MSDKSIPSFRSIAAPLDVDDAALDRINERLGVPTLSKPPASQKSSEAADTDSEEMAGARAAMEKLTIEMPAYLVDAMKRVALDRRTTVRHVVLAAIRASGFEIADADMVTDGRRTRHRLL